MCQQSLHFCLQPATKNMSGMKGSVRQVGVCIPRFAEDAELKPCCRTRFLQFNVQVEEVRPQFGLVEPVGVDGIPISVLLVQRNVSICRVEFRTEFAELSKRARPDNKQIVNIPLVKQNVLPKFIDYGCFHPNHENSSIEKVVPIAVLIFCRKMVGPASPLHST